ncbi:Protein-glutamine gamma-glutamyltransferase [Geobacillus stearothermophilus]|uniref:hypothetical protein n=1 Tax=Geobacillus sp. DSP4a TaxID=2508873 RepID=UPI0007B25625|nr:hypothetical protein [Geobacillus sp. DSP4a]KZE97857.1 Protein-glutamine gamma-glutamyltransferase [Geobacillus stearothermophilus]
MIRILSSPSGFHVSGSSSLPPNEQRILHALVSSPELYTYPNEQQLLFEIKLRSQIVQASVDLAKSRAQFAIFRFSRCNSQFWLRDERGGGFSFGQTFFHRTPSMNFAYLSQFARRFDELRLPLGRLPWIAGTLGSAAFLYR